MQLPELRTAADAAPGTLKALAAHVRAQRPASYDQRVAEARDYWHDRSGAHLAEDIRSTFSDGDIRQTVERSSITLPLVRRVVRKLARLYHAEPVRRVRPAGNDGDGGALRGEAERRYHRIATAGELTETMRMAQELYTLTGLVYVRVGYDRGIFFETLGGDEVLPALPPGAPASDAGRYHSLLVPRTGGDGRAEYVFWSDRLHFVFDSEGRITGDFGDPSLENPYGRIPFVRIDGRTGELFPDPPESLVRVNRVLNFALTELFYTIKFQCFGQPVWVSDENVAPDFKVGVQHLIHVVKRDQAAAGDFRFESPDAPVGPVKETVFEVARLAALLEGVPADTVDARGRVESGVARWLAQADSREIHAAEVARFRTAERHIFRTVAAVLAHHEPGAPLGADQFTLETDFADPAPPLNPGEEHGADEADLRLGVISPADLLRRRNPDLARLSEEEILSLWRRNRELAREP